MMDISATFKIFFNLIVVLLSTMMTYLGIEFEVFVLFTILLALDYITGLMKARAINESITSNKMKYGIISKLSLVIIPIALAISSKAIGADASSVLMIGMNILILSELYSIVANVYTIRTKQYLPEWDAVAAIGKSIRNSLIRIAGDK